MKYALKILVTCLLPIQVFAFGPGSSGGGMPAPPPCRDVPGKIPNGVYHASNTIGFGYDNTLTVSSNRLKVSLAHLKDKPFQFTVNGSIDQAGRIHGEAAIETPECRFKVTLYLQQCGSEKLLLLEIPYWLNDYLYQPGKYNHRCEKAMLDAENVRNSPTAAHFAAD